MLTQDFTTATSASYLNGYSQNGASWSDPSNAWRFSSSLTPPELVPQGVALAIAELGYTPISPNYSLDVLVNHCSAPSGFNAVLRRSGSQHYLFQWDSVAFNIYRYNWGYTLLATSTGVSLPLGYSKLSFRAYGSDLSIVLGDNVILSTTDSVITSAGKVGIASPSAAGSDTTGVHLCNIIVRDVPLVHASLTGRYAQDLEMTASVAGGTSPFSYQWYRSTTSGFTPGTGNALSGKTSANCTDSPPTLDQYFYRCLVTDAAGAVGSSLQITGGRWKDISLAWIGDSITIGTYGPGGARIPDMVADRLARTLDARVFTANAGVAGSRSSDWLPGSANYTAALSTFTSILGSPSPTNKIHVPICLGVNDAGIYPVISAATFQSNIQSICNDLVTKGYTPILCNPMMFRDEWPPNWHNEISGISLIQQIDGALNVVANGTTVLRGTKMITRYTALHLSEQVKDTLCPGMDVYVHPTQSGCESYAAQHAFAFAKIFE